MRPGRNPQTSAALGAEGPALGAQEKVGNFGPYGRHLHVHFSAMAIQGAAPGATAVAGADDDEVSVLRRAGTGDGRAARALFELHVAVVHRHAARILGASDADVEDVVQQTFLAALEGATRFDGRSSVRTWLLGIATRRALDQARSRWRRARWGSVLEWVGLGAPPAAPDRTLDRGEAEALLALLPPGPRTVFVLHEVEGHTLQEISDMTGVGISTLHARLKSARKRLDAAIAAATEAKESGR